MAFKKPYLLAFGFTLLGGTATRTIDHYLFERQKEETFKVADVNNDGYIDLIVDNNWRIILTANQRDISPVDTIDPSYKTCLFSSETQIPNDGNTNTLREQARPLLEYCLRH
ncbi:hypothetical protein EXS74_02175 [Candidatus Woesearchaeota archaeon]|nr:hypothetical protein [Candidatus Woesearchaeota archaeon]